MDYYLFRVWKDFDEEFKEVLVKAKNLEEAEDKIHESSIEFDDYDFVERIWYDDIVV